ncbi:NAPDH dehydrogenase (old yellow enzyme) [Scheffersomyces stipitis CBS 6054]|uniref:NAPDH dehydrogenase (Old yellow enzyme) n=1 Tax=Scheffersomyces stipitis (strain ATCC 58785 / CBS 6054 / NBRC 10063 / NRRL Y-11545) TaxID=322104 RepID=A3LSP2_PICST|nr:NAPDH dehydrogenase (old yellow enzyme) [Scheffersomyces stipitis CBS 6054]ABN65609.1 NAPDH dehydrogenase (old yellow enzyme) [Scheffersomyces stipitis CBS 6054]
MTATSLKSTNLFKPIKVGSVTLQNRVTHLPTTRTRAFGDHTATDLQLIYYEDRSSSPGTLLVTEATLISMNQGLYPNVPGIWNKDQVKSWKKITDAVHKKRGFISVQLWAVGRVGFPDLLKAEGLPLTSPSALYESEKSKEAAEAVENPVRMLTEDEIKDIIYNQYTNAAKNAIEAGFDFLEIHAANGFLVEQFINPSSNTRTDKYGGSIENRARFALELVDHLISVVGADKLAIRISPFNNFKGMLAENEVIHPIATFGYIVSELQRRADKGNELAYISVVDGRYNSDGTEAVLNTKFIDQIWKGVILRGAKYTHDYKKNWETVARDVDHDNRTLIGFGRNFIANPDLVSRLENGLELNAYDRATFYKNYNNGYNTYQFFGSSEEVDAEAEAKVLPKSLVQDS